MRRQSGQKQRAAAGLLSVDAGISALDGNAGKLVHQQGSVVAPSAMPHENIVPQRGQVLIEVHAPC